MKDDAKHKREQQASRKSVDAERNLSYIAARDPRAMGADDLRRDLSAGVAGADNQHTAFAQLLRIAIVDGVQLHDAGIERARKGRDARRLIRRHRNDDVLRFEPLVARLDHVARSLT